MEGALLVCGDTTNNGVDSRMDNREKKVIRIDGDVRTFFALLVSPQNNNENKNKKWTEHTWKW